MQTSVQRYAKKQAIYYAAMALFGAVGLVLGFIMQDQKAIMFGIAIGFLPVGVGGLIILHISAKKPAMARNIEIESDERNQLIRNKSGHTSFWIVFYLVFILTVFSDLIKLSKYQTGLFTLIFMIVVYFSTLYINHKRY